MRTKALYCFIFACTIQPLKFASAHYPSALARVEKVVIKTINMAAKMDPPLSCEQFPNTRFHDLQVYEITSESEICRIVSYVEDSKASTIRNVDTRAKIIIYYRNGWQDSICLNAMKYFVLNGESMEFQTTELAIYIDSLYQNSRVR